MRIRATGKVIHHRSRKQEAVFATPQDIAAGGHACWASWLAAAWATAARDSAGLASGGVAGGFCIEGACVRRAAIACARRAFCIASLSMPCTMHRVLLRTP